MLKITLRYCFVRFPGVPGSPGGFPGPPGSVLRRFREGPDKVQRRLEKVREGQRKLRRLGKVREG